MVSIKTQIQSFTVFTFQSWLTTIFPVSTLGNESQKNDHYEVHILHHMISFYRVWLKRKSTDQNKESMMTWNNKLEILTKLFLLISYGKVFSLSSKLQKCPQKVRYYVEI
jgi:hypothetical protein